jgi:FdhE protein
MNEGWDKMIRRAGELAVKSEATRELLTFYDALLQAQKEVYDFLRSRREWLPTGSLTQDLPQFRDRLQVIFRTVEFNGPPPLAREANEILSSDSQTIDEMLLAYWHSPGDAQFFAKASLQPYARWLAESGGRPIDKTFVREESRCPFCGGMPQVSFLHIAEQSAESGNRHLVCATCLTNWPFRRVVCAFCLEERPPMLGYFHTPEYDHVRIEACDTCKHYIKGVDLTRLGFAVPLVDEVAAAALDVWAHEHGYTKIELNLLGV